MNRLQSLFHLTAEKSVFNHCVNETSGVHLVWTLSFLYKHFTGFIKTVGGYYLKRFTHEGSAAAPEHNPQKGIMLWEVLTQIELEFLQHHHALVSLMDYLS